MKYVLEFSKKYLFFLSGKYGLEIWPSGSAVTLSGDTNMTVAIHTWTHGFGIISLAVNLSPGQKFAANEIHGIVMIYDMIYMLCYVMFVMLCYVMLCYVPVPVAARSKA